MNDKDLIPCPFCGGNPIVIRCGDDKQYFVCICKDCYKTPVPFDEARITIYGAKRTWNRYVNRTNTLNRRIKNE